MSGLESEIRKIAEEDGKLCAEKLVAIGELVVRLCAEESKLLSIVLDYLLKLKLAGGDPDERVRRRTVRMRHILAMIIMEGKKKGEFAPDISGRATSELFYALIEAAVFRITVLGQKDASRLSDALRLLASSMRKA
jgi:hypothetical protein